MTTSFPLRPRRRPLVATAFGLSCLLVGATASSTEWRHVAHDEQASNRADGVGRISAAATNRPAVAWSVDLPPAAIRAALFADVDADGQPEVLLPYQQRVAALDLLTLEVVWATPSIGITELVGLHDVDGDGVDEVVAVAGGMGGGIHVVHLATGALVWSYTDLAESAGVLGYEVRVRDVDGDGAAEIVFASGVNRTGGFYVADLSTPSGSAEVVSGLLQGTEYLNTTGFVVDDFDGDGVAGEIVVTQGADLDLKRVAPLGACASPCGASFCLCDVAFLDSAFPTWALPNPPFSADLDADGQAEYVSIHRHGVYADGIVALDLAPAFLGQALDPGALDLWSYDYTGTPGLEASPIAPSNPIVDLDGDGALEVFSTIFNPGPVETDLYGDPVDDGLDNPGGFAVLVLAGADGAVVATLDDHYAYGAADLDGDGQPEIVTAVTSDWTFDDAGPLEGWQLSCTPGPCALELVWSATDATASRHPANFSDAGFPPATLTLLDPDGDGVPLLLGWNDDSAVALSPAGSTLAVLGSLDLGPDGELAGAAVYGDAVLAAVDSWVTPYDGLLSPLGPPVQPTGFGQASWSAARMAPAERASAVLNGFLFLTEPAPSTLAQADAELFPQTALIRNLDASLDDLEDIVSFEYQEDQGRVLVARHEYDGAGGVEERWTWDSSTEAELARLRPVNRWPFTATDVDADGVEDVVMAMERGSSEAVVVVSGATGATLWILPLSSRDAAYAPLLVADLWGPSGYGDQDGVPDLLRPTRRRLSVYEFEAAAPAAEYLTVDFNSNYLVADLDGDGTPEVVGSKSFAVTQPNVEVYSLLPEIDVLWTSVPGAIGAGSDTPQSLALVPVDAVAGDDVAVISSTGGLALLAGSTGALLPGFPYYLHAGAGSFSPPPAGKRQPLTSVLSWDADGDGVVELIVGSRAGFVYCVDPASSPPAVEWSYFVGGPVMELASADIDGDGKGELLLSTADGVARVLDGLGLALEITEPGPTDCITGEVVTVAGTSSGVEEIDIDVASTTVVSGVIPAADGSWTAQVPFGLAAGQFELVATGYAGAASVAAQLIVVSEADLDGDGVTLCGGDCDDEDAAVAPGLSEICDGRDNDCDPGTDEDGDADGDGWSVCGGDCDDDDLDRSPGSDEVCDDGIDNDCDGLTDGADDDCGPEPDDDDSATTDDDDSATTDDDDSTPAQGDDDDSSAAVGSGCQGCDGCSAAGGRRDRGALVLLGLFAMASRRRRRDRPAR